jgi:hypothetical protein
MKTIDSLYGTLILINCSATCGFPPGPIASFVKRNFITPLSKIIIPFIKALRILLPALGKTELPAPKQGAKGTLNSLDWTLSQKGMRIVRSTVSWPVYHIFLADGEERVITFKKEVWALCNLYDKEGIEGLLQHENK